MNAEQAEAPPLLLEMSRSGLVESRHRGSLVLLDERGAVVRDAGNPYVAMFPRSSLKPVQAVAMLEAGYPGRGAALALAAASHDGEDVHVAGVGEILMAAGLAESALKCPASLPSGREAMLAYLRTGGVAAAICHNCSGKHAAMVATCVVNEWDVASYLAPAHPLQLAIGTAIETMCGEAIAASGVDGCGAPAHAVSLVGLARAFARIATASDGSAAAAVRGAMRSQPRMIGGTGRAVTELTAGVTGLLCKDGAEGVWAAALTDGRAFAVKIEDGADRALAPLLAAALRYWGIDSDLVRRWSTLEVLGGGVPVGALSWSPTLVELLGL